MKNLARFLEINSFYSWEAALGTFLGGFLASTLGYIIFF